VNQSTRAAAASNTADFTSDVQLTVATVAAVASDWLTVASIEAITVAIIDTVPSQSWHTDSGTQRTLSTRVSQLQQHLSQRSAGFVASRLFCSKQPDVGARQS
jgi:hypothetical protein